MRRILSFRGRKADMQLTEGDAFGASCSACGAWFIPSNTFEQFRVCEGCGKHYPISARGRISYLVDPDSFREKDAHLYTTDPLHFQDEEPYIQRLATQRLKLGQSDALTTGTATIGNQEVVLAVLDFSFMGGTMGVVVGEKVARAAELAEKKKRPLITIIASGGARMQEGMLSLLQMAKTAGAIERLKSSGVLHVSVLANPATGGVLASYGSLADVIVAEPESLIGFAGPRVAEQMMGAPLPEGSHSAEFQLAHGLVDAIVDRRDQRDYLIKLFETLTTLKSEDHAGLTEPPVRLTHTSWETVMAARADDRPTAMDYVGYFCPEFVELHGDRQGGDDPAIVTGLARIAGRPTAIVAFERGHQDTAGARHHGRPRPEGYRKAQRALRLAARLHLPVLTLIDTPGAYPGIESEEGGLAGEIARTLELMIGLRVPIVSALIGEGGSGGALALAVSDRMVMQAGAFFSVIAPEGAAAILYRDASRAPELAEKLRITADDLQAYGIVDDVVPEPPGGAASDVELAGDYLWESIIQEFNDICGKRTGRLLKRRRERYRRIGSAFVSTSPPKSPPDAGTDRPKAIPAA